MDGSPEYKTFSLRVSIVFLVVVSSVVCAGCSGSPSADIYNYSGLKPEELLSYTATGTPAQRLEACRCLASHTNSLLAFNELVTLSGDSDKMVQLAAIAGLGLSGREAAVDRLLPFLRSQDLMLPYNAMNALVSIGGKSSVFGILSACQNNADMAVEFRSMINDSKIATALSDGFIALASDGTVDSSLRLGALQSLMKADCSREQIKLIFKAGNAEKDKKISGEFLRCGKALKEQFLKREQLALQEAEKTAQAAKQVSSIDESSEAAADSSGKPTDKKENADEARKELEAQRLRAEALKAEEAAKRAKVLKAEEAAKRAKVLKAEEEAKRAKVLKAEEEAKRAKVLKAEEARKSRFGWIEPSDALSDFVLEANRYMKDDGDRNRAVRAYNRGVEASGSGDFESAIEAYSSAVKELPSFGEAHYALATLYDRQRNYPKGLFHLSQCLLIDPDKSDIYYRIGCNLENQGKAEMAHAFFKLAFEKDSLNSEYAFRAGLIAFGKQDLQGAVVLMKQALNVTPARGDIAQNLAALYLNLGQYSVAREYALKAGSLGADVSAVMAAIQSASQ
jgi:Tfp pilus assembly protein PilF